MDFKEFEKICSYHNLEITRDLYNKFEIYAEHLVEYNQKVNLTAITEHREIYIKHFLDSLIPLIYIDIPRNSTLIDVGTGAGFPSIPIKLYRPDIQLTLLDSLNKRIIFLESLCDKLGINANCIHGRAEDFGKDVRYREQFDFSIARAVANLQVLSEYCIPFIRVGGSFIAMKGLSEDIELSNNAIRTLGGKVINNGTYTIPPEDNRRIIVVKKISNTPKKYPRISGRIKSKPL